MRENLPLEFRTLYVRFRGFGGGMLWVNPEDVVCGGMVRNCNGKNSWLVKGSTTS